MKKRQGTGRLAAVVTAALATFAPVLGAPTAAQAVVPGVAQTYSTLMYRSLTADATMAKLRVTLAGRQQALKLRSAEVLTATKADTVAQQRLAAVTASHTAVHDRLKAAERTLVEAKNNLTRVSKQRPRSAKAVTKAKKAVTTATAARDTRRTKLHEAATVLRAARSGVKATSAGLKTMVAGQTAAITAVEQTRRQIAATGTPASYAAQATTISRGVVDQIRPAFTVADTSNVYGVTVHRSVAFAFKRMIDDAKADGVEISGGGFRTKERQIELRKINGCPDVWTAPSSSCRVPTAIPGRSLHEIGLAVDISSGGKTISRKTKAFTWLQANAAEYGFVNLPSEAWHWSITGN